GGGAGRGGALRGGGDALRGEPLPRSRGGDPHPRLGLDDAGGMAAVVEALAAGHRQRGSHRRAPRGGGRDSGFPLGALPAGGAEIPTFLSYLVEKRLSPKPEEFGKGAIEGVAGPEAANNA